MSAAGQFCSVARALDLLGGRWTLLVVRELLCGSSRFNEIRRGIPRVSKTVLSERLQALIDAGVVVRREGAGGPEYALTEAGKELAAIVGALGTWGQKWLPRSTRDDEFDLSPLLGDMRRRVNFDALPREPLVLRIELHGHRPSYLLLRGSEASLCNHNPGYPEPLTIKGPVNALVAWWRGDCSFIQAQRLGLLLVGPGHLIRAFPTWFMRYAFADIAPAAKQPQQLLSHEPRRMRGASSSPKVAR